MNNQEHVCCLCGKTFKGWGNNPWPLKEEGVCCDDCNNCEVLSARLYLVRHSKENKS